MKLHKNMYPDSELSGIYFVTLYKFLSMHVIVPNTPLHSNVRSNDM